MYLFMSDKDLIQPFPGFLHGLSGQEPDQHHGGHAHLHRQVFGGGEG